MRRALEFFREDGKHMAKSQCIKCGRIKIARADGLHHTKTNQCVCNNIKHGLYKSRIYATWANMKDRCNNPSCASYKIYGAKGITVCKEWNGTGGFEVFYNWAMSNGYNDSLTIDRIDPTKGYYPENCRWITKSENTAHSNKGCQHRRANGGRYYGISPDGVRYEFDNANQFSRDHPELNAGMIRGTASGKKCIHTHTYNGWQFGYVS